MGDGCTRLDVLSSAEVPAVWGMRGPLTGKIPGEVRRGKPLFLLGETVVRASRLWHEDSFAPPYKS